MHTTGATRDDPITAADLVMIARALFPLLHAKLLACLIAGHRTRVVTLGQSLNEMWVPSH